VKNSIWLSAGCGAVGVDFRAKFYFESPEAVSFVYRAQGMYNLTAEGAHTYSMGDEYDLCTINV
jgi:hypothetical protein